MTTNNYFSIVGPKPNRVRVFPFAETSPTGIRDAFAAACMATKPGEHIAVYSMPRAQGPWHQCEIIGHRSERAIKGDIMAAESARRLGGDTAEIDAELGMLYDELTARRDATGVSRGKAA